MTQLCSGFAGGQVLCRHFLCGEALKLAAIGLSSPAGRFFGVRELRKTSLRQTQGERGLLKIRDLLFMLSLSKR
jgi:hypothetical protein